MKRVWDWLFQKIVEGEFDRVYELLNELREEIARLKRQLDESKTP